VLVEWEEPDDGSLSEAAFVLVNVEEWEHTLGDRLAVTRALRSS